MSNLSYIGNSVSPVYVSPDSSSVRQTVLSGAETNGKAAFLVPGSGLRVGLSAAADPLYLSIANGFNNNGREEYIESISSDSADILGSDIPAYATSYIYREYGVQGNTWKSTRVPPLYGEAFPLNESALLHFNGTNGSTTILDDYGNTWAAEGGANISTTNSKFGGASLNLPGTTGSCVRSNTFRSFFHYGFTIEFWFRRAVAGVTQCLFRAQNSIGYGLTVYFQGNVFQLSASRGGVSWDLGSINGTTAVTDIVGFHHCAVVHDPVAEKVYLYYDGVKEIEAPCSVNVTTAPLWTIGSDNSGGSPFNGNIDEFRYSPFCRYPNGTTFTPSNTTFAPEGFFFSIPKMKMYEVTGPSSSAGTPPVLTERPALFVGEVTPSSASISSSDIVSYAYRGRATYEGPLTRFVVADHNIGVVPSDVSARFVPITSASSGSYTSDDAVYDTSNYYDPSAERRRSVWANRRKFGVSFTHPSEFVLVSAKSAISPAYSLTANSGIVKLFANRGW